MHNSEFVILPFFSYDKKRVEIELHYSCFNIRDDSGDVKGLFYGGWFFFISKINRINIFYG